MKGRHEMTEEDGMTPSESRYVVVWHGQYKNDGLERLKWIRSALHVKDAYVRGEAGNWELVVDAVLA